MSIDRRYRRAGGAAACLAAVLLAAVPAPPAGAGFQEGLTAFYRFDYETALEEWIPLAEAGHPGAQYQLGIMYYRGEGVAQDYEQAAAWYRGAAEQGDAEAQLNLGLMYAQGLGMRRDYVQAYKWFDLAMTRGARPNIREKAFRNRENAASVMSAREIAKADKLAQEWAPKTP
jgi:TPR repeat protein